MTLPARSADVDRTPPVPTIRLGLIGAGRIAQAAHLPALVTAQGIDLVAVTDARPMLARAVGARYGVTAHTDTAALLADDLDAVLVAVPEAHHHALGVRALEAGKHVLMEKPLAATADEADDLARRAAAAGLVLQTGAVKRHDPALGYARDQLPRLGRTLSLVAWYRVMSELRPGTEDTLFGEIVADPAARRTGDGTAPGHEHDLLSAHGAHLFDGLTAFAGPPTWVRAERRRVGEDVTWHGTAATTGTDGLVSFELSVSVHGRWNDGMEVYGEHGHISTRSPFPFWKAASDVEVHIPADGVSVVPHFADTNAYRRQAEHFARTVLGRRSPDPSPADGAWTLRWIEAVERSCATDGAKVVVEAG